MADYPFSYLWNLPEPSPEVSLGDFLAANITDNGSFSSLASCLPSTNRRALISPDLARPPLTHRMLKQFIENFTLPNSGRSRALRNNDRVMMALPTGPENALALLAVANYFSCAPVNASCTAEELHEDALRLGARAVVSTREAAERLELDTLYYEHGLEIYFVEPRPSGPAGLFDVSTLGEEVPGSRNCRFSPNALQNQCLVLHTSGTSGTKKVVPYALRDLIIGAACVIQSWHLTPDMVNMNMMPLFHVGGIVRNLWAPVLSGGSTILCGGFDANVWWILTPQLGATWYYAAPTMHHAILAARPPEVNAAESLKIRMICNAAGGLLPSLATELRETFRCAVLPSYGMTECMPIASPPVTYKLDRPGCSGVACGPYISIRDAANLEQELPVGKTGNVCVRGLPTFSGYEKSSNPNVPLDTSVFSSEGWFDSGDCGHMDRDGYLFITGRSKEIINKGGEVVSPFEVEEAIMQACKDRVKQTLAFSVEHTVLQETIGVVIVPQANQPRIGLAELQNSLRNHLHPSKWPFAIVYMDDVPKNQAGKPLRIKLGSRLGLGPLADDVPALDRHFESRAPSKETPLSRPIPCSRITVDVRAVQRACYRIPGVLDAAVVQQRDRAPMAFIQVQEDAGFDASDIDRALGQILHGYVVPNPLHVFRQPLIKTNGGYDFAAMESIVREQNAASMSQTSVVVRDIIAKLLDLDPGSITDESDFFLLGGNSLLLGRLIFLIRKETDVGLEVSSLFVNSTVSRIAALIDEQRGEGEDDGGRQMYMMDEKGAGVQSSARLAHNYETEGDPAFSSHGYTGRSQLHPFVIFVQLLPLVFFYPLKAAWTWTVILHGLAFFAYYIQDSFWERLGALLASIVIARLTSRIVCPTAAIAFKWIVIGRYRPGRYPMWSNYHLRWWIVNQSLRTNGRGIFAISPALEKMYYRLLGMSIGKDVKIDSLAKIGEHDLITIHDRAMIDQCRIRAFCVERDGYFRLEPIVVGRDCVVNTYTYISPGARLADGTVWGPQSSSHEPPAPDSYAAYNQKAVPDPNILLKLFIGYPIIVLVRIISYVPWFAALFLLLAQPFNFTNHDSLESVIAWYAFPHRIGYHFLARIVRKILPPLINLVLGIIIKRILGFNRAGSMRNASQLALFRRWMTLQLLSRHHIKRALDVLGTHYEMTSVIFRAMGAKIGKRVYWPGSGLKCADPELLEIGDDVVFGSRSELYTSDSISFDPIRIGRGAMVADRVVILPGTTIGRQCVMGSGALTRRNGNYEEFTVWMGQKNGEAVSFGKSQVNPSEEAMDENATITPFGRAFYSREASYFVYPYVMIVAINVLVMAVTAAYWAGGFAATVVALHRIFDAYDMRSEFLFSDHWYRPAFIYLAIAIFFVVILPCQALLSLAWVVVTKWLIIGRRREGRYNWDSSNYCQRWQLHLSLQKPALQGFGGHIMHNISGTFMAVMYLRSMGARIGRDCSIWSGGKPSLQLTEPDLVTIGDRVNLDDCSVVAHINSRGQFSLNRLRIGDGCAMRTGSRLLSGASMESQSMLLEHTLVASGEITESWAVYCGWPARRLKLRRNADGKM
ncbi:putative NRPS-like protein biosynthetic cluster [Malassezia sp. CBS 17886]|nr:putative NRPS-like protein biosynthetic cluster [Malassezia sp. CBS 17886]